MSLIAGFFETTVLLAEVFFVAAAVFLVLAVGRLAVRSDVVLAFAPKAAGTYLRWEKRFEAVVNQGAAPK